MKVGLKMKPHPPVFCSSSVATAARNAIGHRRAEHACEV